MQRDSSLPYLLHYHLILPFLLFFFLSHNSEFCYSFQSSILHQSLFLFLTLPLLPSLSPFTFSPSPLPSFLSLISLPCPLSPFLHSSLPSSLPLPPPHLPLLSSFLSFITRSLLPKACPSSFASNSSTYRHPPSSPMYKFPHLILCVCRI